MTKSTSEVKEGLGYDKGVKRRIEEKVIEDAVNTAKKYRVISASLLQRQLMLSYYQALRLLRVLRERKIIEKTDKRGKWVVVELNK